MKGTEAKIRHETEREKGKARESCKSCTQAETHVHAIVSSASRSFTTACSPRSLTTAAALDWGAKECSGALLAPALSLIIVWRRYVALAGEHLRLGIAFGGRTMRSRLCIGDTKATLRRAIDKLDKCARHHQNCCEGHRVKFQNCPKSEVTGMIASMGPDRRKPQRANFVPSRSRNSDDLTHFHWHRSQSDACISQHQRYHLIELSGATRAIRWHHEYL